MARLPKVGEEAWGNLLNEFLLVSHNTDGTEREKAIGALAATVGLADLDTINPPVNPPIKPPLLSHDGTRLMWRTSVEFNVRDYGAVGDVVTDDTDAIQATIDAACSGLVTFPSGVFMVRSIKLRYKGMALLGDGRFSTRIKRYSGTEPLVDMSGRDTGIGHLRYSTISNLQLDGNNMPGVLLRSYYADSNVYREVSFINCAGLAMDFVEVWDSRFENCIWENCGSLSEPATLFRNSTEPGTFGYSTDNTNQIHFMGCRWEAFRNGAIRLDGAANGSTDLLNGIFFVSCKMETSIAAGPAFQIMDNTTVVFVNQLYIAIMAADPAYTERIDAIEDHASHIFMTNVYVQWGTPLGLANSVAHIVRSAPHMYHELGTFYPTESPETATVWVEPTARDVTISSLWKNRGVSGVGNYSKLLDSNPVAGLNIPLEHPGTFIVSDATGKKDLVKISNDPDRPALHIVNATDIIGFSDAYEIEKWRISGSTGAAKFAAGKFCIEATKGYVGINTAPYVGIAMLIKPMEGDRGMAIVRPSANATRRLLEFQDETYNIQGFAIDEHGRPLAVGTPPRVTPGDQTSYANPRIQIRDIAGNVIAAVRVAPTAPGTIATITFSKPYSDAPLCIMLADHSETESSLYVSSRSASAFTVATRTALRAGSMVSFDYTVIA